MKMIFSEISMWTYSKQEISELKPKFEKAFNIKLIHDSENDWEWIWNGSQSANKINISREHNRTTGELSKPLRVNISWESNEIDKERIIRKVQKVLKSNIHFGTIANRGINHEDYKVTKTIEYET